MPRLQFQLPSAGIEILCLLQTISGSEELVFDGPRPIMRQLGADFVSAKVRRLPRKTIIKSRQRLARIHRFSRR